jgi:pimeloyl-ACP methyl ester carboxylesterase
MEGNLDFTSQRVRVGNLDVHYKCFGEGPPIILLHGLGNDWSQWRDNIAYFARSFRVHALDMPGFGLSADPGVPVTPGWYASFMKIFLETVGIGAADVVGHSFGGAVALELAVSFPQLVRRTVVIDAAGLGPIPRRVQWLYSLKAFFDSVMRRKRAKPGGTLDDWVLTEHLGRISSRVMIVWGGRDPYFPLSQAKKAQSLIRFCRLKVFPCTCHAPQKEFPDEFHQTVHKFLTEQ